MKVKDWIVKYRINENIKLVIMVIFIFDKVGCK